MKCLYVGYNQTKNGGGVVSRTNLEAINEIFGRNKVIEFFITPCKSKLSRLKELIFFRGVGLSKKEEAQLIQNVKINKYEYIFFDGSLNGKTILKIKKRFKKIKIISFFHNVDYVYVKEKIKVEGIKNIILLASTYYNERLTSRLSDAVIFLNKRDGKVFEKIYQRKGYNIIPLSLRDNYMEGKDDVVKDIDYLFVGSNFFANVEGITWFINEVMPHIPGKLKVVGKDMEKLREKLTRPNVEIVGTVNSLEEYYYRSRNVICPIFSGSGMKTKTTEALMFGKNIYGTSEAFEGFDIDYTKIGKLCNTKEEFIKSLNERSEMDKNNYSRKIYLEKYSYESFLSQLKIIFEEMSCDKKEV